MSEGSDRRFEARDFFVTPDGASLEQLTRGLLVGTMTQRVDTRGYNVGSQRGIESRAARLRDFDVAQTGAFDLLESIEDQYASPEHQRAERTRRLAEIVVLNVIIVSRSL